MAGVRRYNDSDRVLGHAVARQVAGVGKARDGWRRQEKIADPKTGHILRLSQKGEKQATSQ